MAKEHHCPNCGPQACNASTSKIHTCGVCASVWEEVISDVPAARPVPAPTAPAATPVTAPKPAAPAPAPAAAPKPTAPAPAAPPKPAPPPVSAPPNPSPPATPPTPAPAPPPAAAPPVPKPAAPPAPATATPPPSSLSVVGIDRPAPGGKRLAEVLAAAKVKLCPRCATDNLKQPLDFLEVGGRIVLMDGQSYRPHLWYADTGEPYTAPSAQAAAPAAKAG